MIERRIELRPGYSISRLIHGGWQLAAGHRPGSLDARTAVDDLYRLVDAGLTTFDCADIYTGVEELYGELIARYCRGTGRRSDLQIHTKFVPDLAQLPTLSKAYVESIVDRSLRRLRSETLDLVQFHWWDFAVPGWIEAAAWLAELQQAGKIRHLAVTNFDVEHLEPVLEAGVELVALQVQYSLLDTRPAAEMAPFCARHGIHLLCYGSLAGGFLSRRWLGQPAPAEMANRSLVKYRLIIDEIGGWARFQELLILLEGMSAESRVSISNLAAAAVLRRPSVAAVIVGGRGDDHLKDNLRIFDVNLSAEEVAQLQQLCDSFPGPSGPVYGLEREVGGRHAAIMKTDLNDKK